MIKVYISMLFILLMLPMTTFAKNCDGLVGSWVGEWRVFDEKDKYIELKVSSKIYTDEENMIIDILFSDDMSQGRYFYGNCSGNSIRILMSDGYTLNGKYIGNELILVGANAKSERLDIHLIKN